MLKIIITGAALAVSAALLAGCDNPEKTANERFVGLSSRLTGAMVAQDPVAKWEQLRAIDRDIASFLTELGSTAAAVKIAANEKIGPLTRAEIAREIEQAALHPAVCAKAPAFKCVLAVFEDRYAKASPDEKELVDVSAVAIRNLAGRPQSPSPAETAYEADKEVAGVLGADLILAKKDSFFSFVERSLPRFMIFGGNSDLFSAGADILLKRSFDVPTVTLLRRVAESAPRDAQERLRRDLKTAYIGNLALADDPAFALVLPELDIKDLNYIRFDADKRLSNAQVVNLFVRAPKDLDTTSAIWMKKRFKSEELKAVAAGVQSAALRRDLLREFFNREGDKMTAKEVIQYEKDLEGGPEFLKRAAIARLKTDPAGAAELALALAQFDTKNASYTAGNRLLAGYLGELATGSANAETIKRFLADIAYERIYPGGDLTFAVADRYPALMSQQNAIDAIFAFADFRFKSNNGHTDTGENLLVSALVSQGDPDKKAFLTKNDYNYLVGRALQSHYTGALSYFSYGSPKWKLLDQQNTAKVTAHLAEQFRKKPDNVVFARDHVRAALGQGGVKEALKALAQVEPGSRADAIGSIAIWGEVTDQAKAFRAEVIEREPAEFVRAVITSNRYTPENIALGYAASRSAPSLGPDNRRFIEARYIDQLWTGGKSAELAAIVFAPKEHQPGAVAHATYALLSLMAADTGKAAN